MAYLGEDIKKLGFGLMRLPQKDNVIDVEQVKTMQAAKMPSGRLWSNVIPEKNFNWQQKMQPGSSVKQEKMLSGNLKLL